MMIAARGILLLVFTSTTFLMAGLGGTYRPAKTSTGADPALQRVKNFGDNPGCLRMYMYTPSGTTPHAKRPLVVVIHGCTQSAERIAELSGWNDLADHAGFYVLYVEQRFWNDRAFCFNWYKPDDIVPSKGEVASVNSMVLHAVKHWPVDNERVFVYGVSSGGGLSAAALACYPDVFKAGAVVAGAAYRGAEANVLGRKALEDPLKVSAITLGERITALHPKGTHYPRLIIVHGTDDDVMDFNEGEALAKQWAVALKADTVPTHIVNDFRSVPGVEQRTYRAGAKDAVTFYVFLGLGHKLPVQPGAPPQHGGKVSFMSPDAGIHSTYLIAQGFGLVK